MQEFKKQTWFWNNNFNNFKWRNKWFNETKEQKGAFLSFPLGTLGARLLGNLLRGKGIVKTGNGNKKGKGIVRSGTVNKKGKGIIRAGTGRPLSCASQKQ